LWRAGFPVQGLAFRTFSGLALVGALALSGCQRSAPKPEPSGPSNQSATASSPQTAKVGAPAPDFDLPDLEGKRVRLSELRGKTVVLEWFNPECPFVKASHTKGSLIDTAKRQTTNGVVWLAINSGAPGKQGHGVEKNRTGKDTFGLSHPILLDENGQVGQRYGAQRTPHMYVIDAKGVLVYRGAIDNSPDGEGESPKDGKLVNYVDAALADLAAGRPVATAETEAYGCGVKYGS
jgi:peroxiredoxin